ETAQLLVSEAVTSSLDQSPPNRGSGTLEGGYAVVGRQLRGGGSEDGGRARVRWPAAGACARARQGGRSGSRSTSPAHHRPVDDLAVGGDGPHGQRPLADLHGGEGGAGDCGQPARG